MIKSRLIALYLPQFHPIPENDENWGTGFTEWTNVAKARPLFRGHYQPKIPADLGFYDLRNSWVREEQAELAKEAGIEGFCYWHYWFGYGRRLLQLPFDEVVASGKPDFPFCLCWANHSWSNKTWKSDLSKQVGNQVIAQQLYPGREDYELHFKTMLPAFKDKRYMTVDGKLLFMVWNPNVPEMKEFIETWRELAIKYGFNGVHFVGMLYTASLRSDLSVKERIENVLSLGFDAVNTIGNTKAEIECGRSMRYVNAILSKVLHIGVITKYDQRKINCHMFTEEDRLENVYPTVMPNWDRSPRAGKDCVIYTNSTPEVFEKHIEDALALVRDKQEEHRIITIRSWNEWGEGNYLEPDLKYGRGYLEAIKKALSSY